MFKKVFFLFLMPMAASVIFYSCFCKDRGGFIRPAGFEVQTTDGDYYDLAAYYDDTLFLEIKMDLDCIAQGMPNTIPFVHCAYATSVKCVCGEAGFKSDITGFSVYTDSAYGNYAAGADVTSLFTGYSEGRYTHGAYDSVYYTVSRVPEKLRDNVYTANGSGWTDTKIFLTQKPGNNSTNTFTLGIATQDTVYTIKTRPFRWM